VGNLARAAAVGTTSLITRTASGDYQGDTIEEIATERNLDPVDACVNSLVEEHLDVTMADFVMSEEDIERFLADDRGTFCTDGIFGGKPHPRAIGTFGRILERYVRERDVPSLYRSWRAKAASHPADILGLDDRGYVKEGVRRGPRRLRPRRGVGERHLRGPVPAHRRLQYILVGGAMAVEDGTTTAFVTVRFSARPTSGGGSEQPALDRSSNEL